MEFHPSRKNQNHCKLIMSRRNKLKFSRFVTPFQLCRSKKTSAFAKTPTRRATIYQLSPINPKALDINYPNNLPGPPPSTPETSINFLANKIIPIGYFRSTSFSSEYQLSDWSIESNHEWKKGVDKLKPRIDIQSSSFDGDQSFDEMWPVFIAEIRKNSKEVDNKDQASFSSNDGSTNSSFRSEAGEENGGENESLLFSSFDSSYGFSHSIASTTEKSDIETKSRKKKESYIKKFGKLRRQVSWKWKVSSVPKTKTEPSHEDSSPVRASVLQRMVACTADGKVKESVAVVKKSEDPYEDFKKSMLEMILEKQMFEAKDLEQLLQCFLSLNSRQYHGVIVEAFTEIWEVLFCDCRITKVASENF